MYPQVDNEIMRVQMFLVAIRAVWRQRACLTELGADYLGVDFSFPELASLREWERLAQLFRQQGDLPASQAFRSWPWDRREGRAS